VAAALSSSRPIGFQHRQRADHLLPARRMPEPPIIAIIVAAVLLFVLLVVALDVHDRRR
jgi:hypothetical protein